MHRIYELHPDAYLFLTTFPMLTGRVLLCVAAGALVALAARGREMAAAGILAVLEIALFAIAVLAVVVSGQSWVHWLVDMLPWNCAFSIATVVGGAVVRMGRSARISRPV